MPELNPEHQNTARNAYLSIVDRLHSVPQDRYASARVSPDRALVFFSKIEDTLSSPEMAAAFQRIPADLLPVDVAQQLKTCAWALWHISQELRIRRLQTNSQRVSLEVVEEATQLKHTMLRVLSYYLSEQPSVAQALQHIRSGSGYNDLAQDLDHLARLYDEHHETLQADTVFYSPEDSAKARSLLATIYEELALPEEALQKYSSERRACLTIMRNLYTNLQDAAMLLFRRTNPHALDHFPNWIAASQNRTRRVQSSEPTDAPETPTPNT